MKISKVQATTEPMLFNSRNSALTTERIQENSDIFNKKLVTAHQRNKSELVLWQNDFVKFRTHLSLFPFFSFSCRI